MEYGDPGTLIMWPRHIIKFLLYHIELTNYIDY
jgi:hypothetical protein